MITHGLESCGEQVLWEIVGECFKKTIWKDLSKFKVQIPINLAVLLLGLYLSETSVFVPKMDE